MQPIRETSQAEDLYGPLMWGGVDLLDRFVEASALVRELVPSCVGMSISLREHGVTLTLVASEEWVSLLDAVQYVDRGSCVDALHDGAVVDGHDHSSIEEEWAFFPEASRRTGVEATLSLPVLAEHDGVLGFNLYASMPAAFDGRHQALADLLGAWAGGAVPDQDLTFATRDLARQAPTILKEATDLAIVAGRLAQARGLELREAEDRLRHAAVRAAIPLTDLLDLMREVLPDLPPPRS
ncbi:hypothetical protein BH09ACT12_BH09ACT12_07030 [soil metagenome]